MAKQGDLERADDIFYVPMETLRQFAPGDKVDLKGIVARERETYQHQLRRQRIPRILLSTGEVLYEGIHEKDGGDLAGEGVSPGVAEGAVRVVAHPERARIEPGETFVCPATDPGWTPLFLAGGGLETELGGLLTHGSVVAMEPGIPAVVGVHDATRRLRTGQKIRLDGNRGRITIL
ncbi:MAG: hypothetical protein HYU36_11995 [Planctomycetes bacterium]|nr:hypothetical protein [Planctomycetota bacterium]